MAPQIGVIGASGAVGLEMVKVLADKKICSAGELHLFASSRSAGSEISFQGAKLIVKEFNWDKSPEDVLVCDILLLASSGDFAKQYCSLILAQKPGMLIIDNSSAFRYDENVPLVVPEINGQDIKSWNGKKPNLIANPNCTTAIMAMVVYPIYQKYGLSKTIVSTYQASSGAGKEGMTELQGQISAAAAVAAEAASGGGGDNSDKVSRTDGGKLVSSAGVKVPPKVFQHQLLYNLIPHIDKPQENAYTKEEMKVTWETRKIFGNPDLKLSCTAVRVPVLRAHSESVTLELGRDFDSIDEVKELLRTNAPGVEVVDDIDNNEYPMPLSAAGKYNVQVGRLRRNDVFDKRGLDLFVCGDQLLRGAALNAVLIAEAAMKQL